MVTTVVVVMMILSLAYRAILAEPRIKASSTEDYSGSASRSDYMGGGDTVTPYPPPLSKQPSEDFSNKIPKILYIYIYFFFTCIDTY